MINEIQKSNLLDNNSLAILSELSQELQHTFDSVQIHRTRTEMEVSVLNDLKFPTPASKYWQAIREQNAMLQGVIANSFDYRMESVRLKMLEEKIKSEADPLKRELLSIKKEKKEFQLKSIKQIARHKIREIKEWSEIKKRESSSMSDHDLEDVDNHQLISYARRWLNQAIEMGNSGSPSERANLFGQLDSAIKKCEQKGIANEVFEGYDKQAKLMCGVKNG